MSSEKQGGPPSYEQAGGGYPPPGTQPAGYPGYPPPGQPGYQPPPQQGYPAGQPYPPGPQYGQPTQYGQPMQTQYGQPGQQYTTTTQQVIVAQPGQAGVIMTQARPPDYMIPSILACLCCFCPTGIIAIYYASQANSMAAAGDMNQAQLYSQRARNLMIASVVLGVMWIILVVILRVVVYTTYGANTYGY